MKLLSLSVRNVRSLAPDPATGAPFSIDVGEAMTVLVGPNNCGKSNVVRALELALDPAQETDEYLDAWQRRRRDPIEIVLRFVVDPSSEREQRILELIGGGDQGPDGATTLQHRTELRFDGSRYVREEDFGAPARTGRDGARRLQKGLETFHAAVRLVVTRSGEPVASVLGGRFRQELAALVATRFAAEHAEAMRARDQYISLLDSTLFDPLTQWLTADVAGLFPDVTQVRLRPRVPEIDAMVAAVELEVEDAVASGLEHKGSGVQSGVVAALLRYLAEHSDTSTVFAVEEPEAFLHPAAQEAIRDQLALLGARPDMSVLMTTHSPFTVPRTPDTTVVALAKDATGRTVVIAGAPGDAPLGVQLGGIFRDQRLADMLDAGGRIPPDARAVLVVEGTGDEIFLRSAAEVLGLARVLEGVHIVPGGGVNGAVVQLVMLAAQTERPVAVLFDNDDIGAKAFEKLASSSFKKLLKKGRILSYVMAFPDDMAAYEVEAEDLFSEEFQARFAASLGDEIETYWYDVAPGLRRLEAASDKGLFKARFMQYVRANITAEDADPWVRMLKRIGQAFS